MLPLVGALPCQGFALQLHGACKSNPDMESQFRRRFCRGSKPAGISTAARMRKSSFGLGWVGHTCLMKLCIIGGFNRKTWRGLAQAGLLFEASTSSCNVRDFNTPGSIARSWLLVVSRVLRGRSGSHEGLPLGLHAPLVRPAGAPPLLHPAGEPFRESAGAPGRRRDALLGLAASAVRCACRPHLREPCVLAKVCEAGMYPRLAGLRHVCSHVSRLHLGQRVGVTLLVRSDGRGAAGGARLGLGLLLG